jgi:acetyl-CoA acetyltransferase
MSEAFVLGGVRTPFTKYAGSLSHIQPDDLLAKTLSGACERVGVRPDQIEDIVGGCVSTPPTKDWATWPGGRHWQPVSPTLSPE